MKDHPCILFSGNASEQLASQIVSTPFFGIKQGEIYHHQFASGEWYCQLKENVRGADVFILQSICEPANDNLMQLLIMADAARRASADRITAVMPLCGYSRQERKDKPRVPISAKLVMDILAAAGIDRIITMDLHAQQIQGFTNLQLDCLYFRPTLMEEMKDKNIEVIVSPDIGAVKKASEYADKAKLDVAFIVKKRTNDTTVNVTQFVGDVKDKNVLILDDLTESAGTLVAAAKECHKNKAKRIYAAVTHGCFSSIGRERLRKAHNDGILDHFYCSSTVTEEWVGNEWGTVIDVAHVFGQAIHGIHNNNSISNLFI